MNTEEKTWKFDGKILKWSDGDSLWLTVSRDEKLDLGFRNRLVIRHEHDLNVRLLGVNTPEAGQEGYRDAKDFVNFIAPVGTDLRVETHKPLPDDKYGRWLADLILADGRSVSVVILSEELGVPYFGGKR